MRDLLNPNNRLGQILGKLVDIMLLNLLVLLCCLPIITAGAALTSMHNVLLKIYRGEVSRLTTDFFHAMKANLKKGTLLWLIFLGFLAVLIGLYLLLAPRAGDFAVFITFGLLALACVGTLYFTWSIVLLSRYEMGVTACFRYALLTWAKYPGSTFVFFVSIIITIALFVVIYTVPLLVLLGFTLPGMLITSFAHRVFSELEGPEEETPAVEAN